MFDTLPQKAQDAMDWGVEKFQPYFEDLKKRNMSAENVNDWMADWSALYKLIDEIGSRLYVAISVDTTDAQAEQQFNAYFENIYPMEKRENNILNRKLLDSGLQPDNFEIPLRNIRTEVELFREENLPLKTEVQKASTEYGKIVGAQTVEWDGEECTIKQLQPVYRETDRARREQAWRLETGRQLADRGAINALWVKLFELRNQISANADFADYREYRWRDMFRFDYTPANAETFQNAIEEVVVPAAARLYKKRQEKLGLDTLRPWDLNVDLQGRGPLQPFKNVGDLIDTTASIFKSVDPELGAHFQIMSDEKLLDLDNRKGKAPGGYCTYFAVDERPFIFMNSVGLHDDVQTMLHEGGHAFHCFESVHLPYIQQLDVPMEFAEVASMAMELMAAPYLPKSKGGFYTEVEATRARSEHLEEIILFWPYMAVVDAFQHWAYTDAAASDPANCDAKWSELWDRFMVGIDYSGMDDVKTTGWQRKLHIFEIPFYYIEYGLAQLGAVQVWANSLQDQAGALSAYRKALSLGGTVTLTDLFATAGAKFSFDADTMRSAVELVEKTLQELEVV